MGTAKYFVRQFGSITAAIAVILVVVVALPMTDSRQTIESASGSDPLPAEKALVRDAIGDLYSAGTYSEAAVASGRAKGRMASTDVAEAHGSAHASLESHMTGPALKRWKQVIDEAIDAESDFDHLIAVAGGVDQIRFDAPSQDGDIHIWTGLAHTWSKWISPKAEPGKRGSGQPEGWQRFEARVVQTADGWRVSELMIYPVILNDDGTWHEGGG